MPHDHLSKVRRLAVVLILGTFVSLAHSSTGVRAQSGSTSPAQEIQVWSPPVSLAHLDDIAESEPPAPDIAACEDGTIYVVWGQDGEIWHRVYEPSLGWNEASPVRYPVGAAEGSQPAIATSPDCTLHLVWSKWWFGDFEIFSTSNDGDGFENQSRVSKTSGHSLQPTIAVDSSGKPHVVWVDQVSGQPQLYEGRPIPELPGLWSNEPIARTEDYAQVPALAIDHDDEPHVVWVQQGTSSSNVWYKRPEDWDESVRELISDSFSSSSRLPDMAVSADKVVVVWQETVERDDGTDDDEIYVKWRRLNSYDSIPTARNLSDSDASSRVPAITTDRLGKFFVAWDEGRPTNAVLSRLWWGNGSWQTGQAASNGGTSVSDPAIAGVGDGHVYAVWAQRDGDEDTWDIYFSEMQLETHHFYLPVIAQGHEP